MRRNDEWYMSRAAEAAQKATDPIERGKHAKILLDILTKRSSDPRHAFRSSRELLDLMNRGEEPSPQAVMARRAIDSIKNTRYKRTIYVGRHTNDPAFVLARLNNHAGQPSLQPPMNVSGDHAHRAVVLNARHTQIIAEANVDSLLLDKAVPLLSVKLDYQAEYNEWFIDDPEAPTHIIVGRRAVLGWAEQTRGASSDGIAAEFAQKILDLPSESWDAPLQQWPSSMNSGIYDS